LKHVRAALGSAEPISLLVVDVSMPEVDGFGAVQMIRELVPDLPAIMLTSDDQPGDATRCERLGVIGYAVKPVKRSELLRLVCRALRLAEPRPSVSGPEQETPTPAPRPLRILAAEDSGDNRILLDAYLQGSQHVITFAEDGAAALQHYKTGDYDVVLMDMQMPIMDGLTATRCIRSFERETSHRHTPVLALTANALASDVRAALDAGCDSYLSKPISKQKILAAIHQTFAEQADQSCAAEKGPELSIAIPDGMEQLARRYLRKRTEEMPDLEQLAAQRDFDALRTLAHNMCGTGTSFGFSVLSELGGELEQAALRRDKGGSRQLIDALVGFLSRAQIYLDRTTEQAPVQAP
jgi:CheY-like chemotaxis protein